MQWIDHLSIGAGFLPSTVVCVFFFLGGGGFGGREKGRVSFSRIADVELKITWKNNWKIELEM